MHMHGEGYVWNAENITTPYWEQGRASGPCCSFYFYGSGW